MAASYLRRGMSGPATFSLFVRSLPADRGFLVAAGLDECLRSLERFRFDDDDLAYLRTVGGFDRETLEDLKRLRFTGDVWAIPEGSPVFAGEPLLEVTAPIAEAQLVETLLLNHLTFQTAVASKAARCRIAGAGADMIDFSFRRTHGIEAAMAVARVSAIAGFVATSNVDGARRYGLSPSGTMAHSFIEAFEDEETAFQTFARDFPRHPIFLVDTYDTSSGVRTAITVAARLGIADFGIRLDSGDLALLAGMSRSLLDSGGFPHATIVASGGLDEFAIERQVARQAPIDAYGVGTKMGVSADAPYLDTAYKLAAYGERPVMKLSPGKVSPPGVKQVFRSVSVDLGMAEDLVGLRDEPPPPGYESLLVPVMRAGRRLETPDAAEAVTLARERFERELSRLPRRCRLVRHPVPLMVRHTARLGRLHDRVVRQLRHRPGTPAAG
jgi:nicotinate phosphoribosyltransferase